MRRVMVVLPEPVPPQMPMIRVLVDGGILIVRYQNGARPFGFGQGKKAGGPIWQTLPYKFNSDLSLLWRFLLLRLFVGAPTSSVLL